MNSSQRRQLYSIPEVCQLDSVPQRAFLPLSVESNVICQTVRPISEQNDTDVMNNVSPRIHKTKYQIFGRLKRLWISKKFPIYPVISHQSCENYSTSLNLTNIDSRACDTIHATLPISATYNSLGSQNCYDSLNPIISTEINDHNENSIHVPEQRKNCFSKWYCPNFQKKCGRSRDLTCSCLRNVLTIVCKSLGRLSERRMPNENLFVLSMIQILCGLAAVILSGVAVTKLVFLYQMATGLWSGFLMLATGLHGIFTSRRCNSRTLISLLIFCILVTLAACLLACVSVAGLIEDGLLRPDASIAMLSGMRVPYYDSVPINLGGEEYRDIPQSVRLNFPLIRTSESLLTARRLATDSQPSRLHQVMLHVLLLVIGILEASVSVACAILCCRQVCPSNAPPISAIAYLQNRGAALVPGGLEYLLAVSIEPNKQPPILLDYEILPPDLHPSVQPFIPRSERKFYILTQAETGVHALSAVQTVAGLISMQNTRLDENVDQIASEVTAGSSLLSDNGVECLDNMSLTPGYKLLDKIKTKFSRAYINTTSITRTQLADKRAHSISLASQLPIIMHELNNTDNSPRYKSSLLYVLSSQSPNEPSMVFPPFPPPYHQDKCILNPIHSPEITDQLIPQSINNEQFLQTTRPFGSEEIRINRCTSSTSSNNSRLPIISSPNAILDSFRSVPRLSHTNRGHHSIFSYFRPSRNTPRQLNLQSAAVTLVGDRVLQPVLIIEDQTSQSDRPPSYTVLDHLQFQNFCTEHQHI